MEFKIGFSIIATSPPAQNSGCCKEEAMNKKNILQYGLHLLVIGGVVWAAIKYLNGEELVNALRNFSYELLPIMVALAVTYFLLKTARFFVLVRPFAKNLSKWTLIKAYMSGQAMTLIPGGVAARTALMKQAGVPVAQSSVPVLVHSGWDQAVFLLGGLIAALWFPAARLPVFVILSVLAIISTLFFVPRSRQWILNQGERLANRFDKQEEWHQFLDAIPQTLTLKISLICFGLTVLAFGSNIVTLGLAMRGLDLNVAYPTLFLAFIIPTMLGRLVPVPGGFGVTEASMVGFLTATAGVNTNETTAAVSIFRVVTIVMPAILGMLVYFLFWRGQEEAEANKNEVEPKKELIHASQPDF